MAYIDYHNLQSNYFHDSWGKSDSTVWTCSILIRMYIPVVYNSHILYVFAFSHQVYPVRWPILRLSESCHFQICDMYIYVCPLFVIVRYYGNLMVIFNSIISSNFFDIFPYMRNAILFLVFGCSCIINSFFYSFALLLLCYFCVSKLAFY